MSRQFTLEMFTERGKIYILKYIKIIFKKLISTGTIVCSQPTPAINFSRFPSVTAYVLRAPSSQPIGVLSGQLLKISALELPDHEFPQLKWTNWQPS